MSVRTVLVTITGAPDEVAGTGYALSASVM
jgi:hypothetical protein